MKNKAYFYLAVVISIVLPIIFSSLYFLDQYSSTQHEKRLAKFDIRPEILYKSSPSLNQLEDVAIKDENYESAPYYEFSVVNTDTTLGIKNYKLYLTDIELPNNIDLDLFKWRLFILDYNSDEYEQISTGNFKYADREKLIISPNLKIGKNNIQRFKLYYYLTYNPNTNIDYSGNTFKAHIALE